MLDSAPKTEYDLHERQWTLTRGNREAVFDLMVMAVTFGDPLKIDYEDAAIAVVGRQTDKIVNVIYTIGGMWSDIKTHAVDVKDHFFIKRCLVLEEPERYVDELRAIEGLTYYKEEPVVGSRSNRKRPVNPPETWPYFRNYDHRARLEIVPDFVVKELPTLAVKLDEMARSSTIVIWPGCQFGTIMMQSGESLRDALNDSRIQAVLYAMNTVMPKSRRRGSDQHKPRAWYKEEEG